MRYGVLLVVVLLVGCGLPRDPAGTLARVEAISLRVGVVSNPPWADFSDGEPTGIEVELVNQLASELGTDVQWRPGVEADLFAALEVRAVDLVIGGLTADDPFVASSAATRPYTTTRWRSACEPLGAVAAFAKCRSLLLQGRCRRTDTSGMGTAATRLAKPAVDAPAQGTAQLRSLVAMATLLGGQRPLDQVVELAAEAARAALGAASVSISRWDAERDLLRTMVNVGVLGEHEERFPPDEVSPGEQWWFSGADAVEVEGRILFATVDGDDPVAVELLESVGKESAIAVPIVVEGMTWGELWATTGSGQPRFRRHDAEFMLAIAAHIAAGIASATWRERLAALAYTDSLTGLANRRAFNERLEQLLAAGGPSGRVVLLVCDVDGLKGINDRLGHSNGDQAILSVARALQAAAAEPDALAGRIGGDEFCVLIEGQGVDAAWAVAERANNALAKLDGPRVSLSCGIATSAGVTRVQELFHLADTAQFTAKRAGPGNIRVAGEHSMASAAQPRSPHQRRRLRGSRAGASNLILSDVLGLLDDTLGVAPADDRLVAVAMRLADALDATGWAVSLVHPDLDEIRTWRTMDTEKAPVLGMPAQRWTWQPGSYRLSDYPRTAEVVAKRTAYVVHADDPAEDPRELALLDELASDGVLIAAASSPTEGTYLFELYADARTADLDDTAPWVRLLVAEAVRGAGTGSSG